MDIGKNAQDKAGSGSTSASSILSVPHKGCPSPPSSPALSLAESWEELFTLLFHTISCWCRRSKGEEARRAQRTGDPSAGSWGPCGTSAASSTLVFSGKSAGLRDSAHTLSYLERQGGRRGGAAPAGLEGRTVPAELSRAHSPVSKALE